MSAGLAGVLMRVEAELRGVVAWRMLFGQRFGVDESELAAVSRLRLQDKVVTGVVKSVKPRRLGRMATAAFAILFLVPVLFAVLVSVFGG